MNDDSCVKLVMEGMKKGGVAVVLVGEKIGAAEVVAKVAVQAAGVLRPRCGCAASTGSEWGRKCDWDVSKARLSMHAPRGTCRRLYTSL